MPGSWSKSLASRPLQDKRSRLRAWRSECCVRAVLHSACVCARKRVRVRARDPLELLGPNLFFFSFPFFSPCPGSAGRAALGHPLVLTTVSALVHSPNTQRAHGCQRTRSQHRRQSTVHYCLPWPASMQWQQACPGSCARAGQLPAEYRQSRSPNRTPRRAPSRHQRPASER